MPILCLTYRTEHTITIATTLATVSCAMLALSIPIEGKRVPGRILILTVCLTGNESKYNSITIDIYKSKLGNSKNKCIIIFHLKVH